MRRLWLALTALGVALIAAHWLEPIVAEAIGSYAAADLQKRDHLSSTYSLPVGVATLLVSVVALLLQPRRARPSAAGSPAVSPAAGMASLAVPEVGPSALVRGRAELITELVRASKRRGPLRRRPVRVLHGIGGGGKTTVAQQVALRARQDGVQVWWVSAAEQTDLHTGMRQLARHLGASVQELDHEWADNAPDVLWRRLNAYPKRWLLVIDNADDTGPLAPADEPIAYQRGWIRPITSKRGTVLVTSRNGERATWGDWCHLHLVEPLSPADGAQVLEDHVHHDAGTPQQAEKLATRLGGLPLGLTLAGRYLTDANQLPLPGGITTFADYQNTLDSGDLATIFPIHDDGSTAQARRIISHTWELSLSLLADRGLPLARPLLRLLAVFADAPIPCQHVLDPDVLAASPLLSGINGQQLRGLLHGLNTLGLIDPLAPTTVARLHPLIRDTCRHHLRTTPQLQPTLALAARLLEVATSQSRAGASTDPGAWPVWQTLVPHPLHLLQLAAGTANPPPSTIVTAAEAALRVTSYLSSSGLYPAALAHGQTISMTTAVLLGPEHPCTLQAREEVASNTGKVGDPGAARDQFAELLPIRERTLGTDHRDTLRTRKYLAGWTGYAGDPATARDQFAELLPIHERLLGPEHPGTLTVRHNLAHWTGHAGDPAAARDQCSRLVPLRQRVLGPDHPNTLIIRHNLAYWIGRAGDPVTARDQCRALLPIQSRVFGPEHPSTLHTRHTLAHWTGCAGDPVTARDQLTELLPIRERVLGPDHPDTLHARHNLANWTGHAGDPVTARDQLTELLPIRERVLGPDHPDTLAARKDLADWTGHAGDPGAARDQFADLLRVQEQTLGPDHTDTLTTRHNLDCLEQDGPSLPRRNAVRMRLKSAWTRHRR